MKKDIFKYLLITNGMCIVFCVLLSVLVCKFNTPLLLKIIVLFIDFIFISNSFNELIGFSKWNYKYDERKIEYQRGFFTIKKTIVPLDRVQQVFVKQNPFLDKFDLVIVNFVTTNLTHKLYPIKKQNSEEVVDFMIDFIKQREGDKK